MFVFVVVVVVVDVLVPHSPSQDGLTLKDVQADITALKKRFENKKKNMALFIRNENASTVYTTETLVKLFEAVRVWKEGGAAGGRLTDFLSARSATISLTCATAFLATSSKAATPPPWTVSLPRASLSRLSACWRRSWPAAKRTRSASDSSRIVWPLRRSRRPWQVSIPR